jgi:hypothetical protein
VGNCVRGYVIKRHQVVTAIAVICAVTILLFITYSSENNANNGDFPMIWASISGYRLSSDGGRTIKKISSKSPFFIGKGGIYYFDESGSVLTIHEVGYKRSIIADLSKYLQDVTRRFVRVEGGILLNLKTGVIFINEYTGEVTKLPRAIQARACVSSSRFAIRTSNSYELFSAKSLTKISVINIPRNYDSPVWDYDPVNNILCVLTRSRASLICASTGTVIRDHVNPRPSAVPEDIFLQSDTKELLVSDYPPIFMPREFQVRAYDYRGRFLGVRLRSSQPIYSPHVICE